MVDFKTSILADVPPALLNVILLLLETDPSKRPTAEEICCIPMLAKCIRERQVLFVKFLPNFCICVLFICIIYMLLFK